MLRVVSPSADPTGYTSYTANRKRLPTHSTTAAFNKSSRHQPPSRHASPSQQTRQPPNHHHSRESKLNVDNT